MLHPRPGRLPDRADRAGGAVANGAPSVVALLRAVNLGRGRRVEMATLCELVEGLGCADVRTHLQSGNVVLRSGKRPERLRAELERALAAAFGIEVPVLVRTRDELAAIVARNPLADVAVDPSRYLVSFLSAEPEAARIEELDALDLAPERLAHAGRELYSWHPGGIHASRLARLLTERTLGVTVTARNWNTVTRLLALAQA